MSAADPKDRAEAIRTVTLERDKLLGKYRVQRQRWAYGAARDMHRAIEVMSQDGGLECPDFASVLTDTFGAGSRSAAG